MKTFKYKIGDWVCYIDTEYKIVQRRIENGHLCYKLENGLSVNEKYLY